MKKKIIKFFQKYLVNSKKCSTFVVGEMAEWSIAAVLKTVELRGSGGSNPSLSAEDQRRDTEKYLFFLYVLLRIAQRNSRDRLFLSLFFVERR